MEPGTILELPVAQMVALLTHQLAQQTFLRVKLVQQVQFVGKQMSVKLRLKYKKKRPEQLGFG